MLTGLFPYLDWDDRQKLKEQIIAGKYDPGALYKCGCSEEAREFVNLLLMLDPMRRLSAEEALEHPWMNFETADTTSGFKVLAFLRYLQPQFKLSEAVLTYIALKCPGAKNQQDTFKFLDVDNDGFITKSDLIKRFDSIEPIEVESIIKHADFNGNGAIDYTDWLAAS